jgi:hypothetical protein
MIPKIKYIASYQVSPVSAITHYAEVESIEPWKEVGNMWLISKEIQKKLDQLN